MSNIIVKLHVNADYDPQIGLRGFEGLLAGDGNIQYVVDEYTQITLPNYNTVYKSGYILVGWCEKPESERVNGVDPIYTYYYEPVDDCDLYPVWVSSNISIKQATITPIMSTVTTVTAIGSLSEDERPYAQAAIDAFNTMVDDQVTVSAAGIIRDEVGPIAEQVAREVVQEEFDTWSGGINSRLTNAEGRLDVLETENGEQDDQISALSAQYTGQETRLNGIDAEIEEVNTTVNGLGVNITTMQGTLSDIGGRVDATEADIETLNQTTTSQGNTISGMNNTVSGLTGSVNSIDNRVTVLENQTDGHRVQIDYLLGSVATLDQANQANEAAIAELVISSNALGGRIESLNDENTQFSADIEALQLATTVLGGQIDSLTASVGGLATRVGSLETSRDAQEQRIDDVVGSITNESARIDNVISSIAGISANMTSESARIDNVISSISDVSSDITTLNSKVTDITAQISTQAIQEKAGATASDIAYKMANTVTFRLDGNQKSEATCTLSSQYDYKRVKTLADYKNSSDYHFGTNVVWYNNGVIMSDLDPITSGSVLIGIEPAGAPEIYALPVVRINEEIFNVISSDDPGKAATNFGITRIMVEDNVRFDSSKSYDTCVIPTSKQNIAMTAEESEGCKFSGWYVVSTAEKEGGEPHEYVVVPEYFVTKEPDLVTEATENVLYAALFEGEPTETFYTPQNYIHSVTPWGYCTLYQSQGNTFDEDAASDAFPSELNEWKPMGSFITFSPDDVGDEYDSLLVIVPKEEGLHAGYKIDASPVYLTNDIEAEGEATLAVEKIKEMLENTEGLDPERYNVFGVRQQIEPGKSVIVKITYDS